MEMKYKNKCFFRRNIVFYVISTFLLFIFLNIVTTFFSLNYIPCEGSNGEFNFCFAPLRWIVIGTIINTTITLIWEFYYVQKMIEQFLNLQDKVMIFKQIFIFLVILSIISFMIFSSLWPFNFVFIVLHFLISSIFVLCHYNKNI